MATLKQKKLLVAFQRQGKLSFEQFRKAMHSPKKCNEVISEVIEKQLNDRLNYWTIKRC